MGGIGIDGWDLGDAFARLKQVNVHDLTECSCQIYNLPRRKLSFRISTSALQNSAILLILARLQPGGG